ncbi:MAG: hypothetical protein LKK51_05565 [Eubacterium sp.]|uniref:hypothetical protein n=1 Tax=Eubacterium sp. F2 TaxID=3381348 RepID=UPI003907FAA2|nr:hypothetical protein [Eubacterium sp.]MCI2197507.1 hypothetical protein [Eubacterium sp.]
MVKKIRLFKSICIITGLALMITLLPVLPVSADTTDTAQAVSVNAGSTVNAEYLTGYAVQNSTYSAVLPAGSRTSAWMKVKVKKGTVRLLTQGYVDNSMYVKCTAASGVLKNNMRIPVNRSANDNGKSSGIKLKMYKASTLYIRISRPQEYTSGVVMVKVTQ